MASYMTRSYVKHVLLSLKSVLQQASLRSMRFIQKYLSIGLVVINYRLSCMVEQYQKWLKNTKVTVTHQLPRLYEPLKGSEMAKEGFFSTSEDTLLKLKGKQGPLTVLLELSKMEKLLGTYYRGLPKLNVEMNWENGVLHGTFNQCVAQTGRLSSTKPNLQNFASELKDVFISRYT